MNKSEMALFEVSEIHEIEYSGYKVVIAHLYVPNRKRIVFDIFLLANTQETKLNSFLKSMGEEEYSKTHEIDWERIVGKRGLCEISNDGAVGRYIFIPEVPKLIQRHGTERVLFELSRIQAENRSEIQYAEQYLEYALSNLKKLEPGTENFDETKEIVRGTIDGWVRYGLTAVEDMMVELENTIEEEANNG